jgi:hypothetical protein
LSTAPGRDACGEETLPGFGPPGREKDATKGPVAVGEPGSGESLKEGTAAKNKANRHGRKKPLFAAPLQI